MSDQVIVNEETETATGEFISKRLQAIKNQQSAGDLEDLALIIGKLVPPMPQPLAPFSDATCSRRWQESHLRARESFGAPILRVGVDVQSCRLL